MASRASIDGGGGPICARFSSFVDWELCGVGCGRLGIEADLLGEARDQSMDFWKLMVACSFG